MWDFRGELVERDIIDYENYSLNYVLFKKQNVKGLDMRFETFREVCFQNCKLENVIFHNAFMGRVKFLDCELINVSFPESNLSKVVFSNCKLTSVSFFETNMENVEFVECLVQYSKFENCILSNALLDDVRLKENIHRHNKYNDTKFFKCELEGENFIDTIFKNCDLKTSHFKEVSINIDDLVTSTLSILNMIEILRDKGVILED